MYCLVILCVSCHTLKQILFKYTDRDLKYTKLKSHLQSASVILLLWTYVYLLLQFLLTYGFLPVQNIPSVTKTLLPYQLILGFHVQLASVLCVHEAPGLRPPLLTGFCPQISEDSRFSPKRPKASPYSSGKILIDSLLGRVRSGGPRGINTG